MNKVLVDIDGIIANFFVGFASYLNEKLNAGIDLDKEPSSYDFCGWSDLPKDLVNAEMHNWVQDGGYSNIPIYPKAKEFMDTLLNKYDVYVVTARLDSRSDNVKGKQRVWKDTMDWFERYKLPKNKVVFDHQKVDFCLDNGINVMIEDKLSTVLEAAERNIQSILLDHAWNRSPDRIEDNVYVAYSYGDILNLMEEIYG